MDDFNTQLRDWIAAACQHPKGSVERNKILTRLIAAMQQSGGIWRGYAADTAGYEEALQTTWLWFCKNLDQYDPNKATVLTWFNSHLSYRLKDESNRHHLESNLKVESIQTEYGYVDPIDRIISPALPPPMLEETLQWIKCSRSQLSRIHVRDHPNVNCYCLLCHRLPTAEIKTWQELSQQFGISANTLGKFYNNQCLPELLKFGRSQGYL